MAFPSSPSVGDLHTNEQGVTYRYTNNNSWVIETGASVGGREVYFYNDLASIPTPYNEQALYVIRNQNHIVRFLGGVPQYLPFVLTRAANLAALNALPLAQKSERGLYVTENDNTFYYWNGTIFVASVGGGNSAAIRVWEPSVGYLVNDLVIFEEITFKCISNHLSSTSFENDFTRWVAFSDSAAFFGDDIPGITDYQIQTAYPIILLENIDQDIVIRLPPARVGQYIDVAVSGQLTLPSQNTVIFRNSDGSSIGSRQNTRLQQSITETYACSDYVTTLRFAAFGTEGNYNWISLGSTIFNFTGATTNNHGTGGLVPAPRSTDVNNYLRGDGRWAPVASGGGGAEEWQPNTPYNTNQILEKDKVFYRVTQPHTSGTDFDQEGPNLAWFSGDGVEYTINVSGLNSYQFNSPRPRVLVVGLDNDLDFNLYIPTAGQKQHITFNNINLTPIRVSVKYNTNIVFAKWAPNADFGLGEFMVPSGQRHLYIAATFDVNNNNSNWIIYSTDQSFQGATIDLDGLGGSVPQPLIANRTQFLRGDGSWATPVAGGAIVPWAANSDFLENQIVEFEKSLYRVAVDYTSGGTIDEDGASLSWFAGPGGAVVIPAAGQSLIQIQSPRPLVAFLGVDTNCEVRLPVLQASQKIELLFQANPANVGPISVDINNALGNNVFWNDSVLGNNGPMLLYPNQTMFLAARNLKLGTDFAWEITVADARPYQGATATRDGVAGFVPKPTISDVNRFLRGDGTWADAGGGSGVSNIVNWAPTTLFEANQIINREGALYLVIQTYTSGVDFGLDDSSYIVNLGQTEVVQYDASGQNQVNIDSPAKYIFIENIDTNLQVRLPLLVSGQTIEIEFICNSNTPINVNIRDGGGANVISFLGANGAQSTSTNFTVKNQGGLRNRMRFSSLYFGGNWIWIGLPSSMYPFIGTDGTASGTAGFVPRPTVADVNRYLRSDGQWAAVSGGGGGIVPWVSGETYEQNQLVFANNTLFLVAQNHVSGPNIEFEGNNIYQIADNNVKLSVDLFGLSNYQILSPFTNIYLGSIENNITIVLPELQRGRKLRISFIAQASATVNFLRFDGSPNINNYTRGFFESTVSLQVNNGFRGEYIFAPVEDVINGTIGEWECKLSGEFTFSGADLLHTGCGGLVPSPTPAQRNQFLRGDGMWAEPAGAGAGGYDYWGGSLFSNDVNNQGDPLIVEINPGLEQPLSPNKTNNFLVSGNLFLNNDGLTVPGRNLFVVFFMGGIEVGQIEIEQDIADNANFNIDLKFAYVNGTQLVYQFTSHYRPIVDPNKPPKMRGGLEFIGSFGNTTLGIQLRMTLGDPADSANVDVYNLRLG